jgi:FHA domain
MPDSLLTALKLIFLGLLYLFFVRVIRAVWVELREPKSVQVAVAAPLPSRAPGAARGGGARPEWAGGASAPERLVLREPAAQFGQTFELGDELTVGRASGCGVALPDDTFVSTLHARVFRRDGALFVEDLGSTNGTFVNDRQVTGTVPFHKGDRLQVGKTVLELSR